MLLRGGTKGEKVPRGPLFSLREQIEVTAGRVGRLVGMLKGEEEEEGREKWKVILIGHSVGAYIALEVLRLHRQKFHQTGDVEHWNAGWYWTGGDGDGFDITACILLTPTIFDIAISDNGRAVTPLLRYIPGLPLVVSLAVRGVTMLLPEAWLEMLVKIVMGRGATDEAVGTTVSFLKSGNGVRECLGMAKDEMSEIKEDRWGEEVWGVVQGGVDGDDERKDGFENAKVGKLKEPAELVFYFARKDHWIADQTRDVIIRMRGGRQENAGPKMIVAEDEELVHGWCIRQNGLVARKVAEWVEEIVMRR